MRKIRLGALIAILLTCSIVSTAGAAVAPRGGDDNLARLRARLALADAQPKSDPALVRQHMIDLLTALPDLVPGDAAYANRMARLKARLEGLTPEEAAVLAYVDDAALAPAVEHLKRAAAERRLKLQTLSTKPITPNIIGPLSHPLTADSDIYDTLCGATFSDPVATKALIISQGVATTAAIIAQAACDSFVVALGFGTNIPACVVAAILNEVVNGIQIARDVVDFCDGDISGNEAHADFRNLYHLHDDLINSVANDDQNKTAVIGNDNTNRTQIINNDNTNTANTISNDNSNRTQIINNNNTNTANSISNDNSNRTQIINNNNTNTATTIGNDNSNRTQILNNDNTNSANIISNNNANRDQIITDLRLVACELDRLLNTPEGRRSSSVSSCAGQPGFPYQFNSSGHNSIFNPSTTAASGGSSSSMGRGQDGVAILPMMGTVTMEISLLEGRMIPSYYLPLSKGGMLEQVKTLVWNTINAQLDLNIAVEQTEQARKGALEADQLFVQQRFVEAYRKFAAAYQKLIPPVEPVAR